MMGFNDWIYVTPVLSSIEGNEELIESGAKERLARDIQIRLRGRINPGIDTKSALRAQRIRVAERGGVIVIDDEDQAAVLRGGQGQPMAEGSTGIESLFTISSGIPTLETRGDGARRPVFRSIKAEEMFERMAITERNQAVDSAVTDTFRMGLVDAFDESVKDLQRSRPGRE